MPPAPIDFRAIVVTHLLYLHGFRSSPHSFKAQMLAAWLAQHRPDVTWWCPQLPPSPAAAVALAEQGTAAWPQHNRAESWAVLGSSLGGFYATVLAERWRCKAVVMNPAVNPARDLVRHVGEQQAFHDPNLRFEFRASFVDELRQMTPGPVTRPARYFALIAKGDELLDWREMRAHYPGAAGLLLDGSDHGLSDFAQHLPAVLRFLGLQGADATSAAPTSALAQAGDLAGCFKGGPNDLASGPHHLADFGRGSDGST